MLNFKTFPKALPTRNSMDTMYRYVVRHLQWTINSYHPRVPRNHRSWSALLPRHCLERRDGKCLMRTMSIVNLTIEMCRSRCHIIRRRKASSRIRCQIWRQRVDCVKACLSGKEREIDFCNYLNITQCNYRTAVKTSIASASTAMPVSEAWCTFTPQRWVTFRHRPSSDVGFLQAKTASKWRFKRKSRWCAKWTAPSRSTHRGSPSNYRWRNHETTCGRSFVSPFKFRFISDGYEINYNNDVQKVTKHLQAH